MGGGPVKSKIIPEILGVFFSIAAASAVIGLVNSAVCRAGAAVNGLFRCFSSFWFLWPAAQPPPAALRAGASASEFTRLSWLSWRERYSSSAGTSQPPPASGTALPDTTTWRRQDFLCSSRFCLTPVF